jgi:DNA primase
MSRIPDELIEQVRDTADLVEIIGETVQLKRTGADWRGPCPFHQGTHRNFVVVPKKHCYYCFVCHAAGDVFTWYREKFGMDYPGAVREVARRYGIVIPESTAAAGPDPREPLFQACDAARSWFAAQLRESRDAEPARRHLLDRQFPLDAAAEIGLGYAPRGGEFLAAMKQLGIAESVLLEAALVMRRDDGSIVSRFRNRLLFPIADLRGRTVGFGGRILGPGEPKYLNSPETPIFHKGSQLYHMDVAKQAIRKEEFAILVEGYFDVQRLALAGVDHVVAPLGTALTADQAALLRRYTADVVLLFDSDAAGLRATFRSGDVLLARGVRVRVATLPPGEDPDTLVQRGGAEALAPVIRDAIDVLERKLQLLESRGWFQDIHRAREALDRLLPTLRSAADPVTQELYVSEVAERLGIPRDAVARELNRPASPAAPQAPAPLPGRRAPEGRHAPRRGSEIERKLLRLLLLRPEWLERARQELAPAHFVTAAYRRIWEAILALPTGAPASDALTGLDDRAREVWGRIVEQGNLEAGYDADREYADALGALEETRTFATILAEPDVRLRQQRIRALSKEGQARFSLYHRTTARSPGGRADQPPEE